MNHPLTPSQIAFHQAAKERAARKLAAARENRTPIKQIEAPLDIPATKPKRKSREKVKPVEIKPFAIPEGFTTSFRRSVIQEGEYCVHSGGSHELIAQRSMLEIARHVLKAYPGISISDIKSHSRTDAIVEARHNVIYAIRMEDKRFSLPQIGKFLGGRDHSSIYHAINKIAAREAQK